MATPVADSSYVTRAVARPTRPLSPSPTPSPSKITTTLLLLQLNPPTLCPLYRLLLSLSYFLLGVFAPRFFHSFLGSIFHILSACSIRCYIILAFILTSLISLLPPRLYPPFILLFLFSFCFLFFTIFLVFSIIFLYYYYVYHHHRFYYYYCFLPCCFFNPLISLYSPPRSLSCTAVLYLCTLLLLLSDRWSLPRPLVVSPYPCPRRLVWNIFLERAFLPLHSRFTTCFYIPRFAFTHQTCLSLSLVFLLSHTLS